MKIWIISIIQKLFYLIGRIFLLRDYKYIKRNTPNVSTLMSIPKKLRGNLSGDPSEIFSHYDAFQFWVSNKIKGSRKLRILDIGGMKSLNAILSIENCVTALVLKNPEDGLSNVKYQIFDAGSDDFSSLLNGREDKKFDTFISIVSLHTIGMGRYGDNLNIDGLTNAIFGVESVTTSDANLYISVPIGPDILLFNPGWILSLSSWKELFKNWDLAEILIDNQSQIGGQLDMEITRWSHEPNDLRNLKMGSYKTVFLHFKKAKKIFPISINTSNATEVI